MKRLSIFLCICILLSCVACTAPKQPAETGTKSSGSSNLPQRYLSCSLKSLGEYESWVAQTNLSEDFIPYEQLSFIGGFHSMIGYFENKNGAFALRECYYLLKVDSEAVIMLEIQTIQDEKDPTEPLLSPPYWGQYSPHLRILWNTDVKGHEGEDLRRFENWETSGYQDDGFSNIEVDYYGIRYFYSKGKLIQISWESYGKVFSLTGSNISDLNELSADSDNILSNFLSKSTAPYAVYRFEEMIRANAPEGITQPDSYYYFSLPSYDRYKNEASDFFPDVEVVLRVRYIGGDVKDPEIAAENTGTPPHKHMGWGFGVMDYEGVRFTYEIEDELTEILWVSGGKIYTLIALKNPIPSYVVQSVHLSYLDPNADTPFMKFLRRDTVSEAVSYFEQYLQTLAPNS